MRVELLKNIAEIIAGQSPPSDTYNKSGDGIPFFQGMADYGEKFPVIRTWCRQPTKISLPNDILISVRAPVGPVNINNVEACIGRGLSAIRAGNDYSYEYIFYFLKAYERQIAKLGVGSTFTAITQKDLGNLKILVPETLLEQIKIATVLSKAEALIKQRKESISLVDELLKSIFLKMFGDPVRNDRKWEKKPINKFTNSIVPGRDKPKSFSGQTPWFTTEDLIDMGFVTKSKKELGLSDYEINEVRAKLIPNGSIIMTCVGDLGILSINKEACVVNQQLHTYQCHAEVNNVFLMYNLSFMKPFMYKMASTTTVAYMNKTTCNSIPVIQPPLELQNQFAMIFEKAEALKELYKESLNDLENFYASLSQKAFRGDLDLSSLYVEIGSEYLPGTRIDRVEGVIKKREENIKEKPEKKIQKEVKGRPKNKLTWDKVSSQQVAEWIKEKYEGYHFSNEMLIRFLMDEYVVFPDYYSSEELKKYPQLNGADDIKSFIFSAVSNENPFIKLEQHFYNAEKDTFQLKVTEEDYELIESREPKERSGIYFSIVEQ